MTLRLDDPRIAQEIARLVDDRVQYALTYLLPQTRYGIVATVDAVNRRVGVRIGGAAATSPGFVYPPTFAPVVGDQVRVVMAGADRYVSAVLTGAGAIAGPRGFLGRASRTSIVTVNAATNEELLALAVPVAADRWIRVTFRTYRITTNTPVTDEFVIGLQVDGVNFYERSIQRGSTAFFDGSEFVGFVQSGAAGTKTFRAIGRRISGTASIVVRASTGQGNEAWLVVEDAGPIVPVMAALPGPPGDGMRDAILERLGPDPTPHENEVLPAMPTESEKQRNPNAATPADPNAGTPADPNAQGDPPAMPGPGEPKSATEAADAAIDTTAPTSSGEVQGEPLPTDTAEADAAATDDADDDADDDGREGA